MNSCECCRVTIHTRHTSVRSIRLTNTDLSTIYQEIIPMESGTYLLKAGVVDTSAAATGLSLTFGLLDRKTKVITSDSIVAEKAVDVATAITAETKIDLLGSKPLSHSIGVKATGTVPDKYVVNVQVEVV